MMKTMCPKCQHCHDVPKEYENKEVTCPACKQRIIAKDYTIIQKEARMAEERDAVEAYHKQGEIKMVEEVRSVKPVCGVGYWILSVLGTLFIIAGVLDGTRSIGIIIVGCTLLLLACISSWLAAIVRALNRD